MLQSMALSWTNHLEGAFLKDITLLVKMLIPLQLMYSHLTLAKKQLVRMRSQVNEPYYMTLVKCDMAFYISY
jgi:hypothetical protein